jgi:hypothetical protein
MSQFIKCLEQKGFVNDDLQKIVNLLPYSKHELYKYLAGLNINFQPAPEGEADLNGCLNRLQSEGYLDASGLQAVIAHLPHGSRDLLKLIAGININSAEAIPVITGTPYPGETLTAEINGEPAVVQWSVDGSPVGSPSTTYFVTADAAEKNIQAGNSAPAYVNCDPNAATWIISVGIADGQQLELGVKVAASNWVRSYKSTPSLISGVTQWQALQHAALYCAARTLAGVAVPIKGTAPVLNNFVSGDYNRKTGLIGNASTKFIATGVNANAVGTNGTNGIHYFVMQSSGPSDTSSRRTLFGSGDTIGDLLLTARNGPSENNFRVRVRGGVVSGISSEVAHVGLIGINGAQSAVNLIVGSTATSTGLNVGTGNATEVCDLASSTAPAGFGNQRISMRTSGFILDSEAARTANNAFLSAINTAIA